MSLFSMLLCIFDFFIAVLGPGRVSIGFPEPVESILAKYEPEPTHLDPIRCPNRLFPLCLVLMSSTDPHFGQIMFYLSRQWWLF